MAETKSAQVMIRMRPSVRAALERVAKADNRSLSALIETILMQWLRENGYLKEPPKKA
jgi:hypothetical protein